MRVSMWWKSNYGTEPLEIDLPEEWQVTRVGLNAPPPFSDAEIEEAIRNPIGCRPLREEVRDHRTVCIAVDDLTKPTEAYRSVPVIIDELLTGGIRGEDIYFVISTGTHRPGTLDDHRKKLGPDIAGRFRVYNHNPYQNNEYIGETRAGTKVYINALFLAADYKIGVGMLMPHNLAGFSGGGKIVMPGLASVDAVEVNHRSTLRGLAGRIGTLEGNMVREDIDEAAAKAGLDFIVNSVHGEDGRTVRVFAGKPRDAYAIAVREAQKVYACDVSYQNDIGIFNAFPRDTWFLLSLSSMDVWSTREPERAVVREGGTIVIINYCAEGAGEHGLHTKGMKHYVKRDQHGTFREILAGRDLIFLSPNLHRGIIADYYDKEAALCATWSEVLSLLRKKHGGTARVSVFPCGTLQMDRVVLAAT